MSTARLVAVAATLLLQACPLRPSTYYAPCVDDEDCDGLVCDPGPGRCVRPEQVQHLDGGAQDHAGADGAAPDSATRDGGAAEDSTGRDLTGAEDAAVPADHAVSPDGALDDRALAERPDPDTSPLDHPTADATTLDAMAVDAIAVDATAADAGALDAGWARPGWTRRRVITLQSDTSVVGSDIPVALRLLPARIDYQATRPGGADLRFVDPDTGAALPHEIDTWSDGQESLVWIRFPALVGSTGQSVAVMYYGNEQAADAQDGAAVWSAGYGGVWHLNADEMDSTAHANHCTGAGVSSAIGRLGSAVQVDPGVYLCCGNSFSLFNPSALTVEAWVRPHTLPGSYCPVAMKGDVSYSIEIYSSTGKVVFAIFDGSDWTAVASNQAVTLDQWVHVAGVLSAGSVKLYVDGAPQDDQQSTLPMAASSDAFCMGHNEGLQDEHLDGRLDEVRVSTVARSASWLLAQQLADLDQLLTIGAEETSP